MDILQSIILGVVEGITEFLPISSTGHLILASDLLKISQSNFIKSFEIIIQLGAIFSVVVLYWKSFLNLENLKKLIVAFIPTGIIGLALYKMVKSYLIGNLTVVLWALFAGGVALIVFELWHKESEDATDNIANISYKQSLYVGLFQSIAIIPGVSRSTATIVGGLLVGLKRKAIVEFSFLLAVPTMMAASGLDLIKNADSFSSDQLGVLIVGFVVSFITALLSIRFLLNWIKRHNFVVFGVYRILLTIAFWLLAVR